MACFPRLEELVVAVNSRSSFDEMLVYFERETAKDLEFAAGLRNLWVELLERTNERQLFITELEGLRPSIMSYKRLEFLRKVQKKNVLKLLELRKMIVETYVQVHKKIDYVSVMRTL
uniref:Uncharacterized protein n=1 Tax=Tanacetum cinerariifolium TaxID=118510 RepID=A0A6L2M2P0_TANCI|nr:hypothetical protein [Tanacetum cinerariifolium]